MRVDEDVREHYGWLIAVIICTVANFASNFGMNIQKLALNRRNDEGTSPQFYIYWTMGAAAACAGARCT